MIIDVLFKAGCRNNWHTHPSSRILIIKEGTCFYQEEEKPIQKFEKGGLVNILPGVRHWHGASPDGRMVHIAINSEKGMVTRMAPASDQQYDSNGA